MTVVDISLRQRGDSCFDSNVLFVHIHPRRRIVKQSGIPELRHVLIPGKKIPNFAGNEWGKLARARALHLRVSGTRLGVYGFGHIPAAKGVRGVF